MPYLALMWRFFGIGKRDNHTDYIMCLRDKGNMNCSEFYDPGKSKNKCHGSTGG